jgi:hypothetical protein
MKTLKLLMGLMALIWAVNLNAQTIFSTASGGDWNDTLTWVGWTIPGSTNDVVIAGNVTVSSGDFCTNLTINSGKTLQNNSYSAYTLNCYGNVINNGTIQNNSTGFFYINIYGSIINNGTWSNSRITFYDTNPHNISGTSTISVSELQTGNSNEISAISDLTFIGTVFHLSGDSLHLNGYTLNLNGGIFSNLDLHSGGGEINMTNNCYSYNSDYYGSITLSGIFEFQSGVNFYGPVTISGILRNNAYSAYSVSFKSNLFNYGTVSNGTSVYSHVYVEGNLVNNGTWNNSYLYMTGTGIQTISATHPFSLVRFECSNSAGEVQLNSNVEFINSYLYLGSDNLNILGNTLTMTGGYSSGYPFLSIDGTLHQSNSAYINNNIEGDISFSGAVESRSIHIYGDVTVIDTLRNDEYSSYTCYIHGDLINNGIIQNNSVSFKTNVYGDFHNTGEVVHNELRFYGDSIQEFSSSQIMSPSHCYSSDSTGVIMATSNLSFENTHISFAWEELNIQDFELNIAGSNTSTIIIRSNDGNLNMSNSAYISSADFIGDINFKGAVEVRSNVEIFNNVTVIDTLRNDSYSYYTINIHGNLDNQGVIQNGGTSSFDINLWGDLTNTGLIDNDDLHLKGDDLTEISGNGIFSSNYLISTDTAGSVIALSDLTFEQGWMNMAYEEFDLNGYRISFNGNGMYYTNLYSGGGVLEMTNGAYFETCNVYEAISFEGKVQIYGTIHTYGPLTVTDTLTNRPSYHYTLTAHDEIINNGHIINNTSYYLYIDSYDDVINNGVWTNRDIEFFMNTHDVSATAPFGVGDFETVDTLGHLNFLTNVTFNNTNFDLNWNDFYMNGHTITMHDGNLDEAEVYANGGTLYMDNGAYFYKGTIQDSVNFTGTIEIYDFVTTNGALNIIDTVQNRANYNYNLNTFGTLYNNGVIRNGTNYALNINCYGDLVNNGNIDNKWLTIAGSGQQMFSATAPLSPYYFGSNDTTGYLVLTTDIDLDDSRVDFNFEEIFLQGHKFSLSNNYCDEAIMYSDGGTLNFADGAYLYKTNIYDSVNFEGKVRIHADTYCHNAVTNFDTLENYNNYNYGLTILGNFYNYGTIQNGTSYTFSLDLKGDVFHAGDWTNSYSNLNGENDQTVLMEAGSTIDNQLGMYANESGASTYDWYKDGVSLIGETAGDFSGESGGYLTTNNVVGPTYFGTYYCSTNAGNSRNITIGAWTAPVIANAGTDETICEGASVTLSASAVDGITPYTYAWSNGATTQSISVSPIATTTYTVTVTGTGGTSDADDLVVTVNPTPVFSLGNDQEICDGESAFFEVFIGTSYQWSNGGTAPHLLTGLAGTYTLTVTDVNGCTASDQADVIVNPLPALDLGPDIISCAGTIEIIESNLLGIYLWSTGSTMNHIPVSSSGTYTMTLTDVNGCNNTDNVTVTFNTLPLVDLGADLNLPAGSTPTIDAGAGFTSYLWSTGVATQTIIVSSSGTYTVTVSDANGCQNSDNILVVINVPYVPQTYWVSTTGSDITGSGTELNPFATFQFAIDECLDNDTVIVKDGTYTGTGNVWISIDGLEIVLKSENGPENCILDGSIGSASQGIVVEGETTNANQIIGFTLSNFSNSALNINMSSPIVSNCIVTNSGNGLMAFGGWGGELASPVISYCIFSNNTYDGVGFHDNGYPVIFNSTIEGNTTGIEIYNMDVSCYNNIIVNNTTGIFLDVVFPSSIVNTYNDVWNNTSNYVACSAGTGDISADPIFVSISDFHLQATSPCINAGDPATFDPAGSIADMGAYPFVGVIPGLIADLGPDQTICEGESIIITATTINGTAPFTYIWNTGASSQTISIAPSSTTTYTITVTDSNLASATDNITIVVNSLPVFSLGPDQEICDGESAFFEVFTGNSFLWSNGVTAPHLLTGLAGTYTLTVTDNNGCTAIDQADVIVNPLPALDLGPDIISCAGTIEIIESNLLGIYLWSTGSTMNHIPVSTSGTYTMTLTDVNGCNNTDEVTVTFNTLPIVDLGPDLNLPAGSTPTLDAGAGLTSYLWSTGATSQTIIVTSSDTYTVTVIDANGCFNSDDVVVSIASTTPLGVYWVATTGSNVTGTGTESNPYLTIQHAVDQCIDNDTVIVKDGIYTGLGNHEITTDTLEIVLRSENGAANCIIDGTGTSWSSAFNLSGETGPNNMIVGFTIQNFSAYGILINIASPSILNCIVKDNETGIGSFGGWSGELASPIIAYCLILNNNGSGISLFDNGAPYAVNNTVVGNGTGINCAMVIATLSNNIVVSNTTGIYKDAFMPTTIIATYNNVWSNTTNYDGLIAGSNSLSIDPLFVGSGDYHLQSSSPCINTGNPLILDTDGSISDMGAYPFEGVITTPPTVDLGADEDYCYVTNITLTPVIAGGTSPFTYLWSNGASSATLIVSNDPTATYTVTVTDNQGLTATDDIVVTYNMPPAVDLGPDQNLCEGNFAILATTAPGTYLWSDGSTLNHIYAFNSGTYTVTVTGSNGCVSIDDVIITIYNNPILDLGPDVVSCNGSVEILESNLPGTYLWSTGSTMNHIPVNTSGIYSMTLTDGNGCSSTDEVLVTFNSLPIVDLGPDLTLPFGSTPTLDAGSGMASYAWTTGVTFQTIMVSVSGTYGVTVTDGNGCTNTDNVVVTINPAQNTLTVNAGTNQDICEGSSSILTALAMDGYAPYLYAWSNGGSTASIAISPSVTTTYIVTVTDNNGFTATDQVTVNVHANPIVDLGFDIEICEGGIGFFGVYNTGTFLWSDGSTGSYISPTAGGMYFVTVTDTNGCTGSDDALLIVNQNPVVDLGADIVSCEGSIEDIHSNISGSYQWSNGSNNSYILVSISGTYSLTVTDGNGCSGSDDVLATFNPLPLVDLGADQTINLGDDFTFDAGSGQSSYQWSNGSTSQTITVNTEGQYSVTVTDANGCTNNDDVYLFVNISVTGPGWSPQITGVSHSILIPDTANITIDGVPIAIGDYIGVFFDSSGTPACGGFMVWTGQTTAISAWADDTYTTEKDGFDSGESFEFYIWQASSASSYSASAAYMPGSLMPNQGSFVVNGMSGILSLTANTVDYQYINLPQGWSYFSTYIDLFEPNMDSICQPFVNEVVIAKDGFGMTYWPAWGLNLIGDLSIGEAYQIKLNTTQTMVAEGIALVPELTPITIPQGWSMLGYLRQSAANVDSVLSVMVPDIVIMKDSYGGTYWPAWGLNLIGNMLPGAGYLIKVSSTVIFYYPSNSAQFKSSIVDIPEHVHYGKPLSTGNNMTLGIPLTAWEITPEYGDEISVINHQGIVVGSAVFNSSPLVITIWGTDETDALLAGLNIEETYSLKIWSKRNETESELVIDAFLQGDDRYNINEIAVVEKMHAELAMEYLQTNMELYPNPGSLSSTIEIRLAEHSNLVITIFNSSGKMLIQMDYAQLDAGLHQFDMDVSKLPSGLYYVRAHTAKTSCTLILEVIR